VDYERYGRQIALPEIGEAGQRRIGGAGVAFVSDSGSDNAVLLAQALHIRAGGRVVPNGAEITVDLPGFDETETANAYACSAWAVIEATRRVLGAPPRDMPETLRALLDSSADDPTRP